MYGEKIKDIIIYGNKKIRIFDDREEIYILNLENYDAIRLHENPGMTPRYKYTLFIEKGGHNILALYMFQFVQFQEFVDLNELLDLEPGTIESMFLEVGAET